MTGKFQIEPVVLSDADALREFLIGAIARPGAAATMPPGWLEWLSRGAAVAGVSDIPTGWKLMAGAEIGGVHLIVPFREAAEGGEAISVQSSGYYVDPRWHGPASGALFMALMKYRTRFNCSVSTANEKAARLWQAFKAEEQKGSGDEWCVMRFSPALMEEALVRRVKWAGRLFPREAAAVRDSLPRRLEDFRKNLGSVVKGAGNEAVAECAALPFHGTGALPGAGLLAWRLSAPVRCNALLRLEIGGRPCAAFFTASPRGHRGQAANLSISVVWGPAWDEDPAAVVRPILRAAGSSFPFVTLGFGPVPEAVRPLLRCRALDASRRWLVRSPAQPGVLPGWNGLNSL